MVKFKLRYSNLGVAKQLCHLFNLATPQGGASITHAATERST